MGSVPELLTAVPLHQRPDLVEACAELINEEWKKSRTARVFSLQKSIDGFPLCLVLIRTQSSTEAAAATQLLGHARLSRVLGQPDSLFVETVVVARALRGQGYGRKLMEATEHYARARGFRHLHLTTHDKQHFYAHLGYTLSEPVQSVGFVSSLVHVDFLQRISSPAPWQPGSTTSPFTGRASGANPPPLPSPLSPTPCTDPMPPAPCTAPVPPPPLSAPTCPLNSPPAIPSHPLLPSPAAEPPAPPPLPPPAGLLPPGSPPGCLPLPGQPGSPGPMACSPAGTDPSLLETPYRDLRGLPIFWMKKDI